ncbi:TonB-dependent receptor domain-containing protein [Methylobacillus methanolivorans]|uniref:TonB-dependent receptor domain-containing protein n=1 Tax=Methylobacillus methanolivorans TaxID=1848927 RepID=A0ABW8GHF5_9PROT
MNHRSDHKPHRQSRQARVIALGISLMLWGSVTSLAAELNKKIPQKIYDIPAGDLSDTLPGYAAQSGVLLGFDPKLTQGKRSSVLRGPYTIKEGFDTILKGTGLEAVQDKDGRYQLQKATPKIEDKLPGEKASIDFQHVDAIEVRAKRFYEIGPLPGLGLTKEQIPGNVQSLTAKDIKEAHSLSITDLMNSKLQSVNVNDYQGNPFQMDVQYRGFTAGPQIGTPQGLSVFFDGIRVNEPFGDVVNWDLVPLNALSSFDVFPGSNPVFGLGTLGGALSMKTKDGFNNPGVDAEILTGSFGRRQLQATGGWNNGTVAGFAAANIFLEDGWRENSPSKVNQVFTKGSYRADKLDLNLSSLVAWNDLVGNGLLPSEMYKQNRDGVFTSPDTTDNRLWQFQLSGSYFVSDNFTITAQAYRRNSKRQQKGADVFTEWEGAVVRRNLNPNEQYTCLFTTTNPYNLPDYHVIDIPNGDLSNPDLFDPSSSGFNADLFNFLTAPTLEDAYASLSSGSLNKTLTDPDFVARAQNDFLRQKNFQQTQIFTPGASGLPTLPNGEATPYSNGDPSYVYATQGALSSIKDSDPASVFTGAMTNFYYYSADATLHLLLIRPPTNGDVCQGDVGTNLEVPGPQGGVQTVDGAAYNGTGTGVVEGTPTAIITDTSINQVTDGGSIQFNWNYDKHKFMVGASIDMPSANYKSGQMFGMLDEDREAYLAPNEIRDQYYAASGEVSNSNFKGHQVTKSIYASETWSPVDTVHVTGALRYNNTRGKNKIASRTYGSFVFNLSQLEAFPDYFDTCRPGEECPTGYVLPDASNLLHPPEKEKFSYHSLNPSLGGTWQVNPKLNVYSNWAQGTRVPSVVELGCAFDSTPVAMGTDTGGNPIFVPRSLAQNRACSLPTTLSGDPYLPQIRAQTLDIGMRGRWGDYIEWNVGAYRTDLKDDIYMIGYPGNRNFFDTVGDTKRQGLEAGIAAAFDKWKFKLNYALTEATFQNSFWMPANDNSSSVEEFFGNRDYSRRIRVNPGDRMPGVPLHNLNASVSYQITSAWQIGMTAVAHSFAYVRGNENNEHETGVTLYDTVRGSNGALTQIARRPTTNPGTTPGYVVFNLQTSYRLNSEWTLGLRVNNIFDREYFTAGRLGRNPFSPSINGAIGPSGYNHNSNDWLMTNFLAPGAPRAAWISLSYEFDPQK